MKQSIELSWLKDMAFETEVNGHKIYLDAAEEHGGKNMGPRPKPFMMVALAGCTAMDVVSMLKKMRVDFESFDIKVEADMSEEHPKKYTAMKIIYLLKGKDIDRNKVEKAVNYSQDKYCGVSASYREVMKISYEIQINE